MPIARIHGTIDRRILVNYRIDAEIAARAVPSPFIPRIVRGFAIAGICLIRLKGIRPRPFPQCIGVGSENAAHRFAVEWQTGGRRGQGVFIPRRDSSSRLNALVGGRLFPGRHHPARFDVQEADDRLHVAMESQDGTVRAGVVGRISDTLSPGSVFGSLDEASRFFEADSLGYSTTTRPGRFDGLELRCQHWLVQPLAVERVYSSYFDDPVRFPAGSVTFDCALLMRGIRHQWHAAEDLCCPAPAETDGLCVPVAGG